MKTSQRPPLLLNTMGWTSGLGLLLTCQVLRVVQPHFVLQLEGDKPERNFPRLLTPDYVNDMDAPSWSRQVFSGAGISACSHQLITFAAHYRRPSGRYSAADQRDMSMLGHVLAACQPRLPRLVDLTPVRLILSQVALVHCNSSWRDHPDWRLDLMTLNATVVAVARVATDELTVASKSPALAWSGPRKPVCHCLGVGVVRAVDPDPRQPSIWLVSPLPNQVLRQVNLLLQGVSNLPSCVLSDGESLGAAARPYVSDEQLGSGVGTLNLRRERQHVTVLRQ